MICHSERASLVSAFLLCFGFLFYPSQVGAQVGSATPGPPQKIFYSDPVNGSMNGDGSITRPWGSLQQIVAAKLINGQDDTSGVVHAGDIIYALNGNHGSVSLSVYTGKFVNTDFITLQAYPGHRPMLTGLNVQNCSRWVFRGFTISNPPTIPTYFRLAQFTGSDNIVFDANIVYSKLNVAQWTPTHWATLSAWYGVYFDGTSATITNNSITNVENGVYIGGDSIKLFNNKIRYFSNDGIQFTSSNTFISHNWVTDHYGFAADGYHHDGMQGWTVNGLVTSNVVIDGNFVLASTGAYPTIPPLPTGDGNDYMQGVSIFNGSWKNLTVTNNVIAAAGYHGLSFYGISDSVIANNIVIKQASNPTLTTWLGVFTGITPTSNVIVRNNICNSVNLSTGVIDDHNIAFTTANIWSKVSSNKVASDPALIFIKYDLTNAAFDFNLKVASPAIGAGLLQSSPKFDILYRARSTTRTDCGAYMYTGT